MEYIKEDTKPTIKHRKFAKALAKTGMIGKSAEMAGYESSYGSKLVKSEKILTLFQQELEKQHVNDSVAVEKIKEGFDAYYVRKDGGEKYPDFHAIIKYLDMYLKIKGEYAPDKLDIQHKKVVINMNFDAGFVEGLVDSRVLGRTEAEELTGEKIKEQPWHKTEEEIIDAEVIENENKDKAGKIKMAGKNMGKRQPTKKLPTILPV